MKKLTLIRHAKSDWSNVTLSDFERPLNTRGKKAARTMGRRMAVRKDVPELLISSPAKRARKTARSLAKELGIDREAIEYRKEIYDASRENLIDLVHALPEQTDIALVGHNPGLTELAAWLCPDAPEWLPTCAVLQLELQIDAWDEAGPGCGRVRDYDYPKKKDSELEAG